MSPASDAPQSPASAGKSDFGPDLGEVFGPNQADGGPELIQLLTPEGERVDVAAPGHAVLAIGREDVVLRAQRAAGADLGGLLAEQLGPDAELAVALERGGLDVDAAGEDHVAVEPAQLLGREVVVELGVVDALTLGGQQLDEVGATVGLGGSEDLRQVGTEVHRIGQRGSPHNS